MNTQSTYSNQHSNLDSPSTGREQQYQATSQGELNPADDIVDYVKTYARQNPGTAALWCFGVGFIVGWKLKPW